ncbi:MAG: TIM barrel protein [Fimbriimonadaceae bacterium]|nr:TIM barrel protein [Fimbriimonadaceae bacterium]
MAGSYRFSVGPWNIHEGADPFGPTVRASVPFATKMAAVRALGYESVMLHDDDAVPELERLSPQQIASEAAALKDSLANLGLTVELSAPRLWEGGQWVDGGYTANDPTVRAAALERTKRCIDVCRHLGTDLMVLWLAREGTYVRESKSAVRSVELLLEAINAMLAYDPDIRIAIEPKPNEPMDIAYLPTIGHAVAIGYRSADPSRVGALVESAHAILAGLDPADEMAFALSAGKLWSVHLNDQNGLKYDQDKSFGAANLRTAFDQVLVLEDAGYGSRGEMVAFDVKAMRTTRPEHQLQHLANSREIFLALVDKARSLDRATVASLAAARDYEGLDRLVLRHLLGLD